MGSCSMYKVQYYSSNVHMTYAHFLIQEEALLKYDLVPDQFQISKFLRKLAPLFFIILYFYKFKELYDAGYKVCAL